MNNWNIKELLITALVFVVVDFFFLSSVSGFFNKMITGIQGSPMVLDLTAVLLTYIVLVAGLYYFIIMRKDTVGNAMLLGWLVYFTYELTNKAIIKGWDWKSVLIDGLWGGFLFGITTFIVYQILDRTK